MQQVYHGSIILGISVSVIMVILSTYDVQTYWEKQQEELLLVKQGKYLENSYITLIQQYREGKISKDECTKQLEILSNQVDIHIQDLEKEIKFLNVSHIYKSAKQLDSKISSEIDFLSAI